MRISDWSSDVCSSDLHVPERETDIADQQVALVPWIERLQNVRWLKGGLAAIPAAVVGVIANLTLWRSEERRVGKECVSTCRSRWSPYHEKKKVMRDSQHIMSNTHLSLYRQLSN